MGNPVIQKIREAAMKLPEAEQAWPFGDHEVYRVKGKVFVWISDDDDGSHGVGVKLKETNVMALSLPFVTPMAYGMAKWGWVTAGFKKREKAPLELLCKWVEESYRNTAPKRLLAQLDGGAQGAKKPVAKNPASKPRGARRRS